MWSACSTASRIACAASGSEHPSAHKTHRWQEDPARWWAHPAEAGVPPRTGNGQEAPAGADRRKAPGNSCFSDPLCQEAPDSLRPASSAPRCSREAAPGCLSSRKAPPRKRRQENPSAPRPAEARSRSGWISGRPRKEAGLRKASSGREGPGSGWFFPCRFLLRYTDSPPRSPENSGWKPPSGFHRKRTGCCM